MTCWAPQATRATGEMLVSLLRALLRFLVPSFRRVVRQLERTRIEVLIMVLIKARLYGGPWDGRTVSINVDDLQNPPALRKFGYSRRGPKGRARLHTYRRAARDPWNNRVW